MTHSPLAEKEINLLCYIHKTEYSSVIKKTHKKTTDMQDTMDEAQKYYAEIKKPNTKMLILYDFIFMKLKNRQN